MNSLENNLSGDIVVKTHIKSKPKKMTVECLSCGEDIYIGRTPKIGNYITCDNGSCQIEIIDFEPIDLEPVMVDQPDQKDDRVDNISFFGGEDDPYKGTDEPYDDNN